MSSLANGAWPRMAELVLSSNKLDAAGIAELVHGSWPLLHSLYLSGNLLSEPAALGMLAEDTWLGVKYVQLSGGQLGPCCICTLLQVTWSFGGLELSGAHLDASAGLALAQGHLPDLAALELSDNKLTPGAIGHLVSGSFPHLQYLTLSENRLDATAIQQLVRGDWPEPILLNLDNNCLDNDAIACLNQGDWWSWFNSLISDSLISLQGNNPHAAGVQFLTDAGWEMTSQSLDIKTSTMCEAAFGLLGMFTYLSGRPARLGRAFQCLYQGSRYILHTVK